MSITPSVCHSIAFRCAVRHTTYCLQRHALCAVNFSRVITVFEFLILYNSSQVQQFNTRIIVYVSCSIYVHPYNCTLLLMLLFSDPCSTVHLYIDRLVYSTVVHQHVCTPVNKHISYCTSVHFSLLYE